MHRASFPFSLTFDTRPELANFSHSHSQVEVKREEMCSAVRETRAQRLIIIFQAHIKWLSNNVRQAIRFYGADAEM